MKYDGKEYDINIWQGEELGNTLAIDTETTYLPFTETPDLITMQVFDGVSLLYVRTTHLEDFFIKHEDRNFVFANAPFDIDVIEKATMWKCNKQLEQDKIYDIIIMYRLYNLATNGFVPRRYSLAEITKNLFGVELSKDEEIRTNFTQFKDKNIEEIPLIFLEYGAKDVLATFFAYNRLSSLIASTKTQNFLSHQIQVAGNLALNRIYKNGIGFDEEKATALLDKINKQLDSFVRKLATYGWVRGEKGNQKRYNGIIRHLGLKNIPKTPTGDYSMREEDLKPYKDAPFINMYLEYKSLEKTTQFIRDLKGPRVHPRYDLLKNTGRTGCSKPNFQQLPRAGEIRSMFRAESGKTFLITDYSAIELSTLAQVLYDEFGESVMRDKINEGIDLHKYYASVLFGVEEAFVLKWQRQAAKAANFGFPGGLGLNTFIEFSKGYGLNISRDDASNMKKTWFDAFPEMKDYLNGEKGYVWTRTGRLRNNTTFCAEKNTPFQGLAADGAKLALYNLMNAGFKIVGFVHDEIITEVPEKEAKKLTELQEKIMIDSMKVVVPDVKVGVETTISERYCK
jgi:DNA polymerase I-like protein with 3'-5' exonuclease and polymerase domains